MPKAEAGGALSFRTHGERLMLATGAADARPQTWEYWNDVPCVVMLGDPGLGKSREFEFQVGKHCDQGTQAFLLKWRDWLGDQDVLGALNDRDEFDRALAGGNKVWLYIDALDEGRVKAEEAFDMLARTLRAMRTCGSLDRLRLRLSCRARDWRVTEEILLSRLFSHAEGSDAVIAVTLLPLDDAAIRSLALEKMGSDARVDVFFEAMTRRNVSRLAGHPLLLSMLIKQFLKPSGGLGANRTDIYEAAVMNALTENNDFRRERNSLDTNMRERRRIAEQLAVRLVFGGFESVGAADKDEVLPNVLDAGLLDIPKTHVLEVQNTALFTPAAQSGFEFVHRSLGEYLAAKVLAERISSGLRLAKITSLFDAGSGQIPSPLREAAAWLAGLNAAFRAWLLKVDPMTAAHGDVILYTAGERGHLIETLATRFEGLDWQRDFDRVGDLANSAEPGVLEGLVARTQSMAVRLLGLQLIESERVSSTYRSLAAMALDSSDVAQFRCLIVQALSARAADQYVPQLKALLDRERALVEDEEVIGAVLRGGFPSYISISEALQVLWVPKRPNTLGTYRFFWEHEFANRVLPADRPTALDAFVKLLELRPHYLQLRPFADVFTDLLLKEMGDLLDVARTGPWLLAIVRWSQDCGATHSESYQALVARFTEAPSLRHQYYIWLLDAWPHGQSFEPWFRQPFPTAETTSNDFDLWLTLFRRYAGRPELGKPLFEQLVSLCVQFPSVPHLDVMSEQVSEGAEYAQLWDDLRVVALDSRFAKNCRQGLIYDRQRLLEDSQLREQVINAIENIRRGESGFLEGLLSRLSHVEPLGLPPLPEIAERFGAVAADAYRAGLLARWAHPADSEDFCEKPNTIPGWSVICGYGLELFCEGARDWATCSAAQIDFAICYSFRTLRGLPAWFPSLWGCHTELVWKRIVECLSVESQETGTFHAVLWNKLSPRDHDDVPAGLRRRIADSALTRPLPRNASARRCALRLIQDFSPEGSSDYLIDQARAEWPLPTQPIVAASMSLLSLAAWWLLDWRSVHHVLVQYLTVQQGPVTMVFDFARSIIEVGKGRPVLFQPSWPSENGYDAYIELTPLLFPDPPVPEPQVSTEPYQRLGMEHENRLIRDSMVDYVMSGPTEQALSTCEKWIRMSRFSPIRDWLANLKTSLAQRATDEKWMKVQPRDLDDILFGDACLVRSYADAYEFVCDVIEYEFKPTLKSDHSPAALVWTGTKGAGRTPDDEKVVQDMLNSQLHLLITRRRLIGAREAEDFDAKKSDLRFSLALPSGQIVHIPIEVKWAHNDKLWSALEDQLINRYMVDDGVRFGIYIVAWAGGKDQPVRGPDGQCPATAIDLENDLRVLGKAVCKRRGKTVEAFVIDLAVT